MLDSVNSPKHYTFLQRACPSCDNPETIEVIDIIEAAGLSFHLGNVVKYVLRSPYKSAELEDLKKARWYLDRHIDMISQK